MNKVRKNPLLSVAIIAALALGGCGKGKSDDSNKKAPEQTQPAPAPSQNQTQPQSQENVPENDIPPIAPPPIAIPTPPAQTQQPPPEESLSWSQRLGYGIGNTAAATRDYLATKAQQLSDSATALLSPDEDTQRRRDAMDASQSQSEESRNYDLDKLAREVAVTNPAPVQAIQAALHPNDQITSHLAALLTEPDPARMNVITSQLVDEVFNEPDLARAKVMKVQLGLREIAQNGMYDDNMARRVAFLQANLDRRVKQDASAELLRDGLFIAGTSMALGAVAGFRGFEGLREGVHDMHPSRALSYSRQKLASAWSKTKSGARAIFRRGGTEAVSPGGLTGVSGALRRIRLGTDEIAMRNLEALGVPETQISAIDLVKIRRKDLPYQEFRPTNLKGFRYSVLDSWDGADLGDQRVIAFSLRRWEHGNLRPTYVASRKMSVEEANALESQIRYVSPQNGGKEFMDVVDAETGKVTPTRLTEEEVAQAEGTAAAGPKSKSGRSTRSRKSVAEAQADGDLPPSTAAQTDQTAAAAGEQPTAAETQQPTGEPQVEPGTDVAENAAQAQEEGQNVTKRTVAAVSAVKDRVTDAASEVAQRTRQTAAQVAERSRGAVASAYGKVRPALKSFDTRWAATVAAGTAIPMLGFYYEGYDEGKGFGEGYETLYLESLIPQDRLNQITVDLSPDQAQ
jgi:hypothetical protein